MAIEVVAQTRKVQGRGASRRLRHGGKVPGILYGGKSEPVNIELDQNELYHQLRDEKFHASILTLALDGAKQQVLLRAVNMHPWKAEVQHIDFQRVSADQKIHMKVPLHFVNAEKSPAIKEQGGLITHVLNEIDIRCLPADLPEFVQVDLSNISIGHSIHVRELALPKGVELALGGNENPTVASAQIPKAAIAEEEAAAAAAAAVGVEGVAAPAEAVPAAADVPTVKQKAPEAAAPAADDKGGKGGKGEKADKGDKK
ncbi:MAG TPA: 50S ribosomal protein L25/general stress protein Ctc [Burkholderiales bacterium]|nr:50S ribosomal protein L25/general stress protein Ctc [Burkholderiales bacterium]